MQGSFDPQRGLNPQVENHYSLFCLWQKQDVHSATQNLSSYCQMPGQEVTEVVRDENTLDADDKFKETLSKCRA